MSEPVMPVPAPEPNPNNWDPEPARCSEQDCNEIIDAHPASREDGRWEGWCQFHGIVPVRYPGTQNPEYPDEQEEP